jgi:hypothetical protein
MSMEQASKTKEKMSIWDKICTGIEAAVMTACYVTPVLCAGYLMVYNGDGPESRPITSTEYNLVMKTMGESQPPLAWAKAFGGLDTDRGGASNNHQLKRF